MLYSLFLAQIIQGKLDTKSYKVEFYFLNSLRLNPCHSHLKRKNAFNAFYKINIYIKRYLSYLKIKTLPVNMHATTIYAI